MHILVRASARYEYAEIHIQEGKSSCVLTLQTGLCQSLPCRATGPQRHDVQCPVQASQVGGHKKSLTRHCRLLKGSWGASKV